MNYMFIFTLAQTVIIPLAVNYALPRFAMPEHIALNTAMKSFIFSCAKIMIFPTADLFNYAIERIGHEAEHVSSKTFHNAMTDSYTTTISAVPEIVIKSFLKCSLEDFALALFRQTTISESYKIAIAFASGAIAQANQFVVYHNVTFQESILQGLIGGFNSVAYKVMGAVDEPVPIYGQVYIIEGVENYIQEYILPSIFSGDSISFSDNFEHPPESITQSYIANSL